MRNSDIRYKVHKFVAMKEQSNENKLIEGDEIKKILKCFLFSFCHIEN